MPTLSTWEILLTLRDCTQLMCTNYQGILIPAPHPPPPLSVLSNINNCSTLSPLCQHDWVFAKPVLKFWICQSMKKLENQLLQQVTLSDQIGYFQLVMLSTNSEKETFIVLNFWSRLGIEFAEHFKVNWQVPRLSPRHFSIKINW